MRCLNTRPCHGIVPIDSSRAHVITPPTSDKPIRVHHCVQRDPQLMYASGSGNFEKTRVRTHEHFEANAISSQDRPQSKRPRSGDFRFSNQDALPKWLSHAERKIRSEESSRGDYAGDTNSLCLCVDKKKTKGSGTVNWHARIYVGNLPCRTGLENASYKELFAALYVTAFGSLKPGEAAPVQSFWLHSCRRYGFLQMRGSKEAVNVMTFNGLSLYGRLIRLSRPTGYRPEVKNLSAEQFVPDKVDGERMDVLIKALCGVIAAPREKTYIVALHPKIAAVKRGISENVGTSKSEHARRSTNSVHRKVEAVDKGIMEELTESESDTARQSQNSDRVEKYNVAEDVSKSQCEKIGSVVAMVDMVKFLNLEDKEEYEDVMLDVQEECSRFGEVEMVVIPKEGEWTGTTFVQFRESSHAKQAVKGMTKRGFDGKKIQAYIVQNCEIAEEALKTPRGGPSL